MKTNGRIQTLLALPCYNDAEYGLKVIWPLLQYLGVPLEACRSQFPIENPFGTGQLRLDFLVHDGDLPLVTIEGEPTASLFDTGFKQAKNYSRNFKPRQLGCPMQERTVPFLITAAGNRAVMYRAVVQGINLEYEPVLENGTPAFLEWNELLAHARQMRPEAPVDRRLEVLVADNASEFFAELYPLIDAAPRLSGRDDEKMILFNRVIDLARAGKSSAIEALCRTAGCKQRLTGKILSTITSYKQKIEGEELAGPAVARGYRTFLLQPAGRGGHQFFTGESQSRPYRIRGVIKYRNVARYFTPTEVIQQMVRMAQPQSNELVLDMTCGSGGFLAECAEWVRQREGDAQARGFLTGHLVGSDDDPFCVSCSRELLTFLYPQIAEQFQVFLHNALYQRAPKDSEIEEDPAAERHLAPGRYDLVIGNPPGNDEYSGTNPRQIARMLRKRQGHSKGGLMDHHCFVRRAIELAKPEGGRICLLVPEGLLARDNRGMPMLRREIEDQCELRAIIKLPRVFRSNNARMAILYLARSSSPRANNKVFVAEVREKWKDPQGVDRTTDLFGELESLVDAFRGKPIPDARPDIS